MVRTIEPYPPPGFKSWAADQDGYDKDVTEACLSHVISNNNNEAAYRRTDFYAKRAKLMQNWADYVTGKCPQWR